MKKHFLIHTIFLLLLGLSNVLHAQCDTAIISTYPPESNTGNQTGNLPPQNKNPERPDMRSTFNWMVDDPNTWMTQGSLIGSPYSLLNPRIPNPFMQNGFPLKPVPPIISNSDFHPEDGWELIQRGFGRALDNSDAIGSAGSVEIPYFILYNKFESTLRVFTMANIVGYDIANIVLKFQPGNSAATFSNNTAMAQALNQKTSITELASAAVHPNSYSRWFYADFKMAYDPCVCEFDSRIEVHAEFVETSDIKLYGRLVASSAPIDYLKGGRASAALDPDFLSSMDYKEGSDEVIAGALIYKNINTLAADYNQRMKDYKNEKKDAENLKVWSTAITMGAYVATGGKAFLAKKMKTMLIGGTALGSDKSKNILEGLIYGGKAIGKYTDYYAGRLKEEAKMPGMPSVIQGEMSIRGTLTDHDRVKRTEIGNPGSKNTNAMDDSNWPLYPFYNEPLGVFALFEQPKLEVFYRFSDIKQSIKVSDGETPNFLYKITDRHKFSTRLANGVKYKINPATNPNMENTRVYFALRMKHRVPDIAKYNNHLNWEVRYIKQLTQESEVYLQTPYLPASCFNKMITSIDFNYLSLDEVDFEPTFPRKVRDYFLPTEVQLSVMVILESNEIGKDNNPNRAVHFFTYPVVVDVDNAILETSPYGFITQGYSDYRFTMSAKYDSELNFNSKTLSSSNQYNALQNISFKNGTMNVNGGSTVYEAGNYIEITNDYEVLVNSGDVTFQIFDLEDTPPTCSYDTTGLVNTKSEVEQFCRNGSYKGYQLSKTALENQNKIQQKKSLSNLSESKIYPNPTLTGSFIVETFLETESFITINVYDFAGKKLLNYHSNETLLKGNYKTPFDNTYLEPGIYLVEVETNQGKKTYKLIKN